jgi:hypothetical protein
MPSASKLNSLLLTLCVIAATMPSVSGAHPQQTETTPATPQSLSSHEQQPRSAEIVREMPDEFPDDELAPAAVQMDVSNLSPLLLDLYQATRETKEQQVLDRLSHAKGLIEGGADLKATDPQGRTALHWAVFGASYHTKPNVLVAYEEIADSLIQRGVEINKQDVYQDTALDYLLYSPSFEMQTLLIENGASSGFLAAFYTFFNQVSTNVPPTHDTAVALTRRADLAPGATLDVRLDVPVYSDRSRTGDPIEATVTYPLCRNGEQLACKDGELLVSPGTKVNGTVLFAAKAPDKYSRPRMVLDFSNIVHKDGQRTPLYARVLFVDNARETVRNNEILGIIQPHASTKFSLVMAALGAANPIAAYTIKGVQTVYGLSLRREILFPTGADIQVQVVRASMLRQKDSWTGWPQLPLDAPLKQLVTAAPQRTHTPNNTPSDVTNLMFIGSQQELVTAFLEARWFEADSLNAGSAMKVVQATMRQSGYAGAPVSALLINNRPPDLVFQKSLNTFAKRHHVRIWKLGKQYQGRDVWVGAATHDIATTSSRANTKWSHRIDPHIDRERDWVEIDLLFVGTATAYVDVDRPQAPRKAANATGDDIVTDGKMSVVQLAAIKPKTEVTAAPALITRP